MRGVTLFTLHAWIELAVQQVWNNKIPDETMNVIIKTLSQLSSHIKETFMKIKMNQM